MSTLSLHGALPICGLVKDITPELDAVTMCRELIRIDSSNYGDGSGPGEREAAEYVMEKLTEVGWDPEYFESADRRASVVLRIPGIDPTRPALVVHGHTDVVPAQAQDERRVGKGCRAWWWTWEWKRKRTRGATGWWERR